MSSLAWIDFDEAERQRAQRIMALFQERETRDELGLGAIRDSIADHLFPGTSTIQTRLRYMLFIPWLYRALEKREVPEAQLRTEARDTEIRLADALKAGGESNGIIGRDAGPRLQRLPSSVYWAGLGAWGIRVFPGSLDSLFVALRGRGRSRGASSGEDALAAVLGRLSQTDGEPPLDPVEVGGDLAVEAPRGGVEGAHLVGEGRGLGHEGRRRGLDARRGSEAGEAGVRPEVQGGDPRRVRGEGGLVGGAAAGREAVGHGLVQLDSGVVVADHQASLAVSL